MWPSLLVQNEGVLSSPYTHIGVHACVLQRVSDPVCCALACGYLEVSADMVSACGSGFTIFCLTETCINLAESFTVRERSFCLSSTFFCSFTSNFIVVIIYIYIYSNSFGGHLNMIMCSLYRWPHCHSQWTLSLTFSLALHGGQLYLTREQTAVIILTCVTLWTRIFSFKCRCDGWFTDWTKWIFCMVVLFLKVF